MKLYERIKIREPYGKIHGDKLIRRSFNVDKRLWGVCIKLAKEKGVSVSFLIRKALLDFLSRGKGV